jgi:putative ABC transport system permease protein
MTTPGRHRFQLPRRTRASIQDAVDTELQFHIDMRAAELVAGGMTTEAAREQAVQEFGDIAFTRRYCREEDLGAQRRIRVRERLDELRTNVVYAVRSLRRSPGFTAVALITLALAIGANTAVFGVANAVFLAPLPYGGAGELVALYENNVPNHFAFSDMSPADIVDYREMQRSLTGIAVLSNTGMILRDDNADPVVLHALRVSANMFDVLAARPLRGRTFAPDEDTPAKRHVVILGYPLWQRAFGGDTTIIGRKLTLSEEPYQVIGVMPEGFGIGYGEELWVPIDLGPTLADVNRARKFHFLYGIGRLRPHTTVAAASADLNAAARTLEARYPAENAGHFVTIIPIKTAMTGDARGTTFVLVGAAALVLLIACANLTNMMLARAVSRRREMTVRAAIGAGRGHLVRQLLTESITLAVAGGALGAALAMAGTKLVTAYGSALLPPMAHLHLDWRVFAFCLAASVVMGVVFGLIPALSAARLDLSAALQESSRGSAGDRRGERLRGGLVFVQVAMAVVLLAAAGLLVRSLDALSKVNLGFEPAHILTADVTVHGPRYQTDEQLNHFYDAVFAQLRRTPGVTAVGAVSGIPLLGSSGCGLNIEGQPPPAKGYFETRCMGARGDYFKVMGAPLVAGRMFDDTDLPTGPQVVVINKAMAKQFWPRESPLGKRIRLGPNPTVPWETVIGVVGDMRQGGLDVEPMPTAFEYDAQHGWGSLGIVVRTAGDPLTAAPAIRAAVRSTDPTLAVRSVQSMSAIVGGSLATRRFSLGVILAFALLALTLAAVGVYGVLAYAVTSRMREFGIRMALGASGPMVLRLVLRKGLAWSAGGLVVGISAALAGGRWIEGMLYQVRANDAPTLVATGAFLLVVVLGACFVPARRATKVDPVIALREE